MARLLARSGFRNALGADAECRGELRHVAAGRSKAPDRLVCIDEPEPAIYNVGNQMQPAYTSRNDRSSADAVSDLLRAWGRGDLRARDDVLPLVYRELRKRAARYLRQERPDHTLQPTALVHEAYLRLVGQDRIAWQNRAQFYGIAAQMMRRILVDHARARKAAKRPGGALKVSFDDRIGATVPRTWDLLALDEALNKLQNLDPRLSQIVELRYFAGLSEEAVAEVMAISRRTVTREWQTARAWLYRQLTGSPGRSRS
jgi:RNA polymerase sigma factor (TIGR02999 family)